MSRDWQTYLADVKTASDKVLLFTAGMDCDSFFADDKTYNVASTQSVRTSTGLPRIAFHCSLCASVIRVSIFAS